MAGLTRHGKQTIFNTEQASQFTSSAFTGLLLESGIAISMDGRGAWRDNVFVGRPGRLIRATADVGSSMNFAAPVRSSLRSD